MKIVVDEELRDFFPPLGAEDVDTLRQSLEQSGCLAPIVLWDQGDKAILIDGHHRFEICRTHKPPIACTYKFLKFETKQDVLRWMIDFQLGRRDLTRQQKDYYRGKRYLQEVQAVGGVVSNGTPVAKVVAEKLHVRPQTILQNATFAQKIDALRTVQGPDIANSVLRGERSVEEKLHNTQAADAQPDTRVGRVDVALKQFMLRLVNNLTKRAEMVGRSWRYDKCMERMNDLDQELRAWMKEGI